MANDFIALSCDAYVEYVIRIDDVRSLYTTQKNGSTLHCVRLYDGSVLDVTQDCYDALKNELGL